MDRHCCGIMRWVRSNNEEETRGFLKELSKDLHERLYHYSWVLKSLNWQMLWFRYGLCYQGSLFPKVTRIYSDGSCTIQGPNGRWLGHQVMHLECICEKALIGRTRLLLLFPYITMRCMQLFRLKTPCWCIGGVAVLIKASPDATMKSLDLVLWLFKNRAKFTLLFCITNMQLTIMGANAQSPMTYLKNPQMPRRYWMATTTTFPWAERASPS